jgi:hypothetical protein
MSKYTVVAVSTISIFAIGYMSWNLITKNDAESTDMQLSEDVQHYISEDSINIAEFSPTEALRQLRENVSKDPDTLMISCHEETHLIGHKAYALLGEEAYQYADPMCGGGYLHGVTEQAFKSNGLADLQKIVHEQCDGDMLESCLHGVGHGIHQTTKNVEVAVQICNQLSASSTDCFDGVFMDLFDTHDESKEDLITAQKAYSICGNTSSVSKHSCYFYLPRITTNADASTVVELCDSPQIKTGWAACANGSGVFFMKQTSGFRKEVATQYCDLYRDKNYKTLCINGVEAYAKYGSLENTKWH